MQVANDRYSRAEAKAEGPAAVTGSSQTRQVRARLARLPPALAPHCSAQEREPEEKKMSFSGSGAVSERGKEEREKRLR